MKPVPLVSVVIPCLNRAGFLSPTIESVLRQRYPNIECLVIDGGSRDGSVDILKRYGDRIRWISEPDNGHSDAINKGWKMSRGEILAWLNADDVYVVPDAVGTAADYLQNHPDVDVVYGDHALISEDGKVISDIIRHRPWDLVHAVKYCDHIITQPASFIKRSILEKAGWLDPDGIDHDLWYRIGLIGKIQYLPVHLAYGRQCPGRSQQREICEYKVRMTEKFLGLQNLPPPFNSDRFRRRALSNSHLAASELAWRGGHKKLFFECLQKAVATDPLNRPHIVATALKTIVAVSLPVGLKRVLMRWLGLTHRPRSETLR